MEKTESGSPRATLTPPADPPRAQRHRRAGLRLRRLLRPAVGVAAIVVAPIAGGVACADPDRVTGPAGSVEPLVLAFYYPWYGRPDGPSGKWYHWNPDAEHHDATHTPALGLYDSNDPVTVRQHIRWAQAAGIDAFIASWWGPSSFEERSLGVLVRVAEEERFRVTALIEHPFTADELRTDVHALLATHATSPAWLRADGRPVIFVYARIMNRFGPEDFRRAFAGTGAFTLADTHDAERAAPFDGVFSYGPVDDLDGYLDELGAQRAAHRAAGRVFVAATLPGYDDRVIREPGRLVPRADGALYRRMWSAARAAGADWVTVTSWNEWHEGTEIEPSLEHAGRYLGLTRTLAEEWRAARR